MTVLVNTLPIFIIIAFGYGLSRYHFFAPGMSSMLTRLIFYIVMPVTLFIDLAQLPIHQILNWQYMGAYLVTSLCLIAVTIWISRVVFHESLPHLIINAMAATHANTAYLALPLFMLLLHTVAPVASIIVVQSLFNFLIVLGLELSTQQRVEQSHIKTALSVLWKTPLLIGIFLGLLVSALGLKLPTVIDATFGIVKQSAAFLALLALGLSIGDTKASFDAKEKGETLVLIGFKSLLHPCLAFMIGHFVFHLSPYWLMCLTLMAAMPAAKNLFVFSQRYGLAVYRANVIVLSTTLISVITINLIYLCFYKP